MLNLDWRLPSRLDKQVVEERCNSTLRSPRAHPRTALIVTLNGASMPVNRIANRVFFPSMITRRPSCGHSTSPPTMHESVLGASAMSVPVEHQSTRRSRGIQVEIALRRSPSLYGRVQTGERSSGGSGPGVLTVDQADSRPERWARNAMVIILILFRLASIVSGVGNIATATTIRRQQIDFRNRSSKRDITDFSSPSSGDRSRAG